MYRDGFLSYHHSSFLHKGTRAGVLRQAGQQPLSPLAELGNAKKCDPIVPSDGLNLGSACFDRLIPLMRLPACWLLLLFVYSQQPSDVVLLSFTSKHRRAHIWPC